MSGAIRTQAAKRGAVKDKRRDIGVAPELLDLQQRDVVIAGRHLLDQGRVEPER